MKGRWALKAAKMFVLLIVGSLAIGLAVMLLWNALVPELFHGPALSFCWRLRIDDDLDRGSVLLL